MGNKKQKFVDLCAIIATMMVHVALYSQAAWLRFAKIQERRTKILKLDKSQNVVPKSIKKRKTKGALLVLRKIKIFRSPKNS